MFNTTLSPTLWGNDKKIWAERMPKVPTPLVPRKKRCVPWHTCVPAHLLAGVASESVKYLLALRTHTGLHFWLCAILSVLGIVLHDDDGEAGTSVGYTRRIEMQSFYS